MSYTDVYSVAGAGGTHNQTHDMSRERLPSALPYDGQIDLNVAKLAEIKTKDKK